MHIRTYVCVRACVYVCVCTPCMRSVQVICTHTYVTGATHSRVHRCLESPNSEQIQNRCVELRALHFEMAYSSSLVMRQQSPNELSSAG